MREDPLQESLLVRYLLGDLPETEELEVEDRAFRDPHYLRQVQAVEGDLIDAYVRGELSEGERRQFEGRFFASAERRRKVEFARALARVAPEFAGAEKKVRPVSAPASVRGPSVLDALLRRLSPAARYGLAAAALLLVIGGSWLIVESLRLRAQLGELRAAQQSHERQQQALEQQIADEQAHREELATQLQRERERSEQLARDLQRELEESATTPSPSAVISLALWPDVSRGGGARPKVLLTPSARQVRVQIGVEPGDEYQRFRVELRAPGGGAIWTRGDLSARRVRAGRAVMLDLPAHLLRAGGYELSLKGVTNEGATEDVGFYYFDVLKK